MLVSEDPASTPSRARGSRASLTGSLRRGLSAWRDAVKRRDVAITFLLVVLSACGGVLYATRDRERFEMDVDDRARRLYAAIDTGLERPLGALAAVHGLFLSDPGVTRVKFHNFVAPLLQRYPAIYALEWMPIVPAAEREAYEAEGRAAGFKDYRFWTFDPSGRRIPIWPRPEYGPIQFMEPPSNDALFFDILADPFRLAVAERARDIGMVTASKRFRLIEDANKEDVFSVVIYQPVFDALEPPGSMAGRRAALRGFVLAVFRLKPLLEASIGPVSTEGLRFALSDRSGQAEASEELFESEKGAYESLARLRASAHVFEMPLNNPNHSWWLRVAAQPRGYVSFARGLTVALAGALLAVLALVAVTALRAIVRLRRRVERVGPYTLVGRLGRGAMGVVYEARHALLRRPTAIKLLAPGVAGERALARFEREVQLTAALTHPSTVAIYDYGRTEKGVFYYAMELLRGVNLQHLVSIDGPLPSGRVVHLLEQACGALAEAHAAGLIHRDVKPANLMACKAGGILDFLKVLDFGLVKDLGAHEAAPPAAAHRPGHAHAANPVAVSQDGSLLGTPLYLAPEGVTSPNSVDARLDIYGLGAVAYFLLCGSPPFTGATAIEIYARQRRGSPPPPSGGNEPVPPELSAIVLECLAFKPESRPASARELRARLTACAGVTPWTEAMAAAWWEERGPAVEAAAHAARDAAGDAGTITTGARRLAPDRDR
jgi:CHASE1-domain containing sensor protein